MAKTIVILSGKGGVGKTTTTVNLGVSLHKLEKDVVVVDTNLATPNIALQLGFPPSSSTLHNVLRGKISAEEAIFTHDTGLRVITAGLSMNDSGNHFTADFKSALAPIEADFDLILMDCGAGLWSDVKKSVRAADEALIVTNPELPAIVDSLKAIKMAENYGIKINGIIVNKVTGASYELRDETIEGTLKGYPIIAKIPFDRNVPKSISRRKPIVTYRQNSPAARAFRKLAHEIAGAKYTESLALRLLDFFGLTSYL